MRYLFSAGVGFTLFRKAVVRPGIPVFRCGLARFRRRGGSSSNDAIPVLRGIGNSPDISSVVQGDSDQKIAAVTAQRHATRNAAGSCCATRQVTQQDWRLQGQCLQGAESAALGTHYNNDALGRKRMPAIHAGDNHRDLHAHSRAAPGRFWCEYFHAKSA